MTSDGKIFEEKIRAAFLDIVGSPVVDSDAIESLGLDSLDEVELIMKFEEVFDIEINENEAEDELREIKTVRDVMRYLKLRQVESKLDKEK